ncbi:MAG: hypothetical protein ACT4OT_11420 [Acidobacteriota bacterium]
MKSVLITNNHLTHYAGSELVTLELAKHFKSLGWETEIGTFEIGEPIAKHFSAEGLRVNNLLECQPLTKRFDLIWAQHHPVITEYLDEDNYSLCNIVINCLSPTEPLEAPPLFVDRASVILANSKETRDALVKCGLEEQALMLFPNSLSDSWFSLQSVKSSNRKLRKIAVVSNHIPDEIGQLRENNCGLEFSFIGMSERYEMVTPELVSTFDAAITISRTVPQALAQMVPVFCYDKFGGPGWLIEDNFDEAEYFNFSGRCTPRKMESAEILNAIVVGFPEAVSFSSRAHELCRMRYSLKRNIESVLDRASRTPRGSRLDKSRLHHIKRVNRAYISAYQKVSQLRGLVRARTAALAKATQEIRRIDENFRSSQDAATRTASEVGRLSVEPAQAIERIRERDDLIESLRRELAQQTAELADRGKSIVQLNAELATTRNWDERVRGELRETLEQQKVQLEALSGMVEILVDRGGDEVREQATELRHKLAYDRVVRRIREVVGATIPPGAKMLVINKGDERMLEFADAAGWHFPQNTNGSYAGYYPANGMAAIAHLEALRAKGADFLVIPKTAFWWLDRYPDFKEHVERFYELTLESEEACTIYDLRQRCSSALTQNLLTDWRQQISHLPVILDWNTGVDLRSLFPECDVFSPVTANGSLPYVDHSIDVVAVSDCCEDLQEARRVASEVVLRVSSPTEAGARRMVVSAERVTQIDSVSAPSTSIVISRRGPFPGLRTLNEFLDQALVDEVMVLTDVPENERGRDNSGSQTKFVTCVDDADFITATNRAGRHSKSEVLVFIDHEVALLPGCLPALLQVLREHTAVGAVGGKILNFDGSVWEAGGEILRDDHLTGFGRGDQKSHLPRYNYVRQVDFCSAGVLAVRSSHFKAAGGFNAAFSPVQSAIADFCLRLQKRGSAVFYQPEAVAVRFAPDGGVKAGLTKTKSLTHKPAASSTRRKQETVARGSSETVGVRKTKNYA